MSLSWTENYLSSTHSQNQQEFQQISNLLTLSHLTLAPVIYWLYICFPSVKMILSIEIINDHAKLPEKAIEPIHTCSQI